MKSSYPHRNMEDRMASFKKSIQDSQTYLQYRIDQAKATQEESQAAQFSAEMAVMYCPSAIILLYYTQRY